MRSRLLVNLTFVALLCFGLGRHVGIAGPPNSLGERADLEPGGFPDEWIRGLDCLNDPQFQVHEYNENFYIIRQSKCDTFEAPFMYLIFGEERALLMDTGSNPNTPIADVVFGVMDMWLNKQNGGASLSGTQVDYPLIVAHTHGHGDHVQGDGQFIDHPRVDPFVSAAFNEAIAFWGFDDYPNDMPTIDLGNRIIDVIGTPGHHPASVTLYDRATGLLMTGDIVYPGHLFVFSLAHWTDFVASIERLIAFTEQHPVSAIVGCHIEMSDGPLYFPYAWGTPVHPTEHPLQFEPGILHDILEAAEGMGGVPHCQIFSRFVIHPVYECGITWNG